jgi:hypothetical protein
VLVGGGLLVAEEPAVVVLDRDPEVVDDPESPKAEDVVDPMPPADGLAEPHPASTRVSRHPAASVDDRPARRLHGRRRTESGSMSQCLSFYPAVLSSRSIHPAPPDGFVVRSKRPI